MDRKPEIVQVNQAEDGEAREDWDQMMSGIKLETEQAINLAVLKVKSNETGTRLGPQLPNGLVVDGEALLVPGKFMAFNQNLRLEDWEMTIGASQLIEILEQKNINFFVYCFKKSLCPLLNEQLITMGVSPKRLKVEAVNSKSFGQNLDSWLSSHPKHLYVGDNPKDVKKVLSMLKNNTYKKRLNKSWYSRFFITLPNAQSRVAKWHNFDSLRQ
jgi:hypothetical protein